MKRTLLLLCCLPLALRSLAWGPKGHDVVACIAESHLSRKAAAAVDRALDGHSPVYYANWLDNASHTPEYAYTKTWHYLNVDEGHTLATMPRNERGDVLRAVEEIVERLRRGGLSHEEEAVQLKMLIHLVGDMHCPMHAGRATDLGGNRLPVLFFNARTNLHSVWDSSLVEAAHKWSYTEWRQQIDRVSASEAEAIVAGTPADWMAETVALCAGVYERTPEGTKISYDYIAAAAPVIERQLLRGGLRLAHLLNSVYR